MVVFTCKPGKNSSEKLVASYENQFRTYTYQDSFGKPRMGIEIKCDDNSRIRLSLNVGDMKALLEDIGYAGVSL